MLVLVIGRGVVTRMAGRLGGDSGDKWEMSFAEDGSC